MLRDDGVTGIAPVSTSSTRSGSSCPERIDGWTAPGLVTALVCPGFRAFRRRYPRRTRCRGSAVHKFSRCRRQIADTRGTPARCLLNEILGIVLVLASASCRALEQLADLATVFREGVVLGRLPRGSVHWLVCWLVVMVWHAKGRERPSLALPADGDGSRKSGHGRVGTTMNHAHATAPVSEPEHGARSCPTPAMGESGHPVG